MDGGESIRMMERTHCPTVTCVWMLQQSLHEAKRQTPSSLPLFFFPENNDLI